MFKRLITKITGALAKNRIPYMIIGGQAVLLYGSPRLTNDIDITLGINLGRLAELVKVVKTLKLSIIPNDYQNFVTKTMVLPVIDKASGIRVDFILSFTAYEQKAMRRAKGIRLGRSRVKFASLEDVIIHKVFAGRPRDLEDIQAIILKNPRFDIRYIRYWLKQLNRSCETATNFLELFNRLIKNTSYAITR